MHWIHENMIYSYMSNVLEETQINENAYKKFSQTRLVFTFLLHQRVSTHPLKISGCWPRLSHSWYKSKIRVSSEWMVQIQLQTGHGVETPPPKSFSGGYDSRTVVYNSRIVVYNNSSIPNICIYIYTDGRCGHDVCSSSHYPQRET